jgi:uncharacterized membrane-anchored protein YitT (DUF2179 family)
MVAIIGLLFIVSYFYKLPYESDHSQTFIKLIIGGILISLSISVLYIESKDYFNTNSED